MLTIDTWLTLPPSVEDGGGVREAGRPKEAPAEEALVLMTGGTGLEGCGTILEGGGGSVLDSLEF